MDPRPAGAPVLARLRARAGAPAERGSTSVGPTVDSYGPPPFTCIPFKHTWAIHVTFRLRSSDSCLSKFCLMFSYVRGVCRKNQRASIFRYSSFFFMSPPGGMYEHLLCPPGVPRIREATKTVDTHHYGRPRSLSCGCPRPRACLRREEGGARFHEHGAHTNPRHPRPSRRRDRIQLPVDVEIISNFSENFHEHRDGTVHTLDGTEYR